MNDRFESVLDAFPFEISDIDKAPLFLKNLLEELVFHYENNDMYRRFCQKEGFDPQNFEGQLCDIPAIPVHVFKALGNKLSSVTQDKITTKLQSSATSGMPSTILLDKTTARRQTKAMARVMQQILGPKRRPFCIMDIDPSSPNRGNLGARLAAINGYLNFSSTAHYFIDAIGKDAPLEFLVDDFIEHLKSLDNGPPIVVFGFTFVLYHTVFQTLKERGIVINLPIGSQVIHIGGWKKLEEKKVDKKVFNAQISSVFGINSEDVIDIYGFTEQMGLNYPDCKAGWKHLPVYSEVLIRNEADLSICPDGTMGLLEFLSPLQHSYPGNVVLTDDLGVSRTGKCECGYVGRRFKVLGRAQKAEVRGCGDIMSEKVSSVIRQVGDVDVETKLDILHAPKEIDPIQPPSEQLLSIIEILKLKQLWLSRQPQKLFLA